ncbi:MAG: TrkH family potassium uptake protein [Spirochaetia bacterium]|nr:TrkH family potassium uptake protein [Spirochaetia bacterium]
MNIRLILKVVSVLLMIVSGAQSPSILWALYYHENNMIPAFLIPEISTILLALLMFLSCRNLKSKSLSAKDGFFTVASIWFCATAVGAIPFYISGAIPSYTDAFFETMSGFTTTGASILTDIESLPKSLLFWRNMTHYLGGLGIIVLAVAVFPLLGIGSMRMIKAETTGPTVQKIMPKITGTAKILWLIYMSLTICETICLLLCKLSLFDALTTTMSTVATGGFSVRNASIAAYASPCVEIVVTVFMFLSGINFVLYFSLAMRNFGIIRRNTELKVYTAIFIISTLMMTASLFRQNIYPFLTALRYASFQSIAIMTTTGFYSANYIPWPAFTNLILLLLMFCGGCSGSTSGNIKVIRHVVIWKHSFIQLKKMMRPNAVYSIKKDGGLIGKDLVPNIYGFFTLYFILLVITAMFVSTGGHDLVTCISTAISTVGNVGPGFGGIGPVNSFGFFQGYIKWFLCFIMLTGRLELYTIMILFTPTFWKR